MAFKNKMITNSKTGHVIRFIHTAKDTDGKLLEMEMSYEPQSDEPPQHYHPYQTEDFTVLAGELSVRIDSEVKILKQGDILHIPQRKIHSMWNGTRCKTVVNWKVTPALTTEYMLENLAGLANDNKTNNKGMPGLLQAALIANKFSNVFRLAKPAFAVQQIVFGLLSPIAYLLGFQADYEKYTD